MRNNLVFVRRSVARSLYFQLDRDDLRMFGKEVMSAVLSRGDESLSEEMEQKFHDVLSVCFGEFGAGYSWKPD